MSTATHTDLITPTAAARKELPPERYQITRQAVIDQVAYHVACHNALVRAADAAKSNKAQLKLLGEAEDELGIAERTIEELESLASDEDVDHVLEYLQRVHHWAPRDIRPKKMERTPRQVRSAHKLPTNDKVELISEALGLPLPPKAVAPFVRQVPNPGHRLGEGATAYDGPMPNKKAVRLAVDMVDHKLSFKCQIKLAHENEYYVAALDFSLGRADSKNGGWGMYTPIHRSNGEFRSELEAVTYFLEEMIEHMDELPKQYPKALPADFYAMTRAELLSMRNDNLALMKAQGWTPAVGAKATTAPGPGEPGRYFYPDKNLPYIHTHQLEPWIWVAKDGTCWLFEVPLAPGWTLKDNDHLGPLQVAPKGIASEAYYAQKRVPLALGAQPANGKIKMMVQRIKDREALKRDATNAANVTKKAIGSKLKKKLGHQAGDVLPDGTMVADPTAALLELHDQVNEVPLKVEAVPAGKTIEHLLPATPKWTPPDGAAAANLTDLAKPFGQDRRQREVVKKRFRSLYGKLSNMDAEERAAFLAFVNAKLQ